MNNLRLQFADELEALLGLKDETGERVDKIATWAYRWRLVNQDGIDDEVDAWLIGLGFMSMGEQFEIGDGELRQMVASARSSV